MATNTDGVLLSPKTGTDTSSTVEFTIKPGEAKRFYAYPIGDLTASETVATLQFADPAGTFANFLGYRPDASTGTVVLSDTLQEVVVEGEGHWRWNKAATTNAVGIGFGRAGND